MVTATFSDGIRQSDDTCNDWTSDAGGSHGGDFSSTKHSWTSNYSSSNACSFDARLYCFGVDRSVDVTPSPPPSRIAFLTLADFSPGQGIGAADALCQTEARSASTMCSFAEWVGSR